jgi:hypothetical protein
MSRFNPPEEGEKILHLLLAGLDARLSTDLVIWCFPLAFFVHDLEEIFTMERFVRENKDRFPKPLRGIAAITTRQFTLGVVVLFAITILASFLATRPPRDMTLFNLCVSIFLLHVFTHVAQPIMFRKYTPGLITAVFVVLPYSLYAIHRLFKDGSMNEDAFTTSILVGALLVGPIILGVRQIGKMLTHR